jgi:hypothetical protein
MNLHTTLGVDYMLQDIRFGADSRSLIDSAFVSYAQQISPSLTVSIFGGPQYSRTHEVVVLPLGFVTLQIPVFSVQWNWAVGGAITKRTGNTVFQFTAQRQVSDGGGLIGAVVSSSVGASVRRRLPGRWDAIWSGGYANNSSLDTGVSSGGFQSETAGFGLEHSLADRLSLRMRYDFQRQRGTGETPLLGNLERNLWSVQLLYQFRQIPLGR